MTTSIPLHGNGRIIPQRPLFCKKMKNAIRARTKGSDYTDSFRSIISAVTTYITAAKIRSINPQTIMSVTLL